MLVSPPCFSHRIVYKALSGWFIVTLVAFVAMLFHQSDRPVLAGRYSLTYMLQLGVMLAALLATGILAWRAGHGRLPERIPFLSARAARYALLPTGCLGLMVFWALMPGTRFQPAIMLFLVYGLASLFLIWLLLLHEAGTAEMVLPAAGHVVAVILLIGLAIGLRLAYPISVPQTIQFDEAWITNWGYSLYTTGQPVLTMMPAHPVGRTILFSAVLPLEGWWLAQAGISLAAARLFWLVLCWLSAPFIYLTARFLYGQFAALVALLLALCVPLFHNYVRPDCFVPLPLAIGLYYLVTARDSASGWRYGLAGLALALTVEGHALAVCFPVVFGVIIGGEYVYHLWRARRWVWYRPFFWFWAGGLMAVLVYGLLRTVPWGYDIPRLLEAGTGLYNQEAGIGGGESNPLMRFLAFFPGWFVTSLTGYPLEWVLYLAGMALALWRRQKGDVLLAGGLLAARLLLFLLIPKQAGPYYGIHTMPFVALLGGALLAHLTRSRVTPAPPGFLSLLQAAALTCLAGLMVVQAGQVAQGTQNVDKAIAVGYETEALLPPEVQRIAGEQYYYFGLHRRQFTAIEDMFFFVPLTARRDYWERLRPQAFLVTRGIDDVHESIFDYLADYAFVRVRCFPIDIYQGVVELYLSPEFAGQVESGGCRAD